MFCLLAVLVYLCGEVSKKGCQCSCPVERKGYCISVNVFLYFNSKVFKRLPKQLSMRKKNHKKNLVKLPYSAQKVLLRASILTAFCFDLQSRWWYRLGCKCLTALLTLTEARLKDPRYRQNKRFHKFLYLVMH